MASEYLQELELNLDQIIAMQGAQYAIYEESFNTDTPSGSQLAARLGAFSTVLGVVFIKSTSKGLAAGIVSIITGMVSSQKSLLASYVKDGHFHMSNLVNFLRANTQYDRIKVKLPFLEYEHADGNIRFVTGKGIITGAHNRGGTWDYMN
ncbi:hypothetical protein [Paenibacillus sp. UMB4589-SE434]|uniref:hypothetical protein n=1 Tax=Paenibacillus sp. UMB4589-SE434 TaxID=3046314 RepID=UPI00254A4382|nr:hypothetical protein [Paenibacillus sp. UMB4589-SE434]MDK8182276.1 hypothetical protein [Paenibacillus sp. UMB4589-SE434]